jgi:Arc/MetJ-type ribon-helix-helix transcriptional regulator
MHPMPRQLSPQHEALIDRIAAAGHYTDVDDVITEALRLLDAHDRQVRWLRSKMATAAIQVERGEVVEFTDDFLDELDREVDERMRRGDTPGSDVCP